VGVTFFDIGYNALTQLNRMWFSHDHSPSKQKESEIKRLGNPESGQRQHALKLTNEGSIFLSVRPNDGKATDSFEDFMENIDDYDLDADDFISKYLEF